MWTGVKPQANFQDGAKQSEIRKGKKTVAISIFLLLPFNSQAGIQIMVHKTRNNLFSVLMDKACHYS